MIGGALVTLVLAVALFALQLVCAALVLTLSFRTRVPSAWPAERGQTTAPG